MYRRKLDKTTKAKLAWKMKHRSNEQHMIVCFKSIYVNTFNLYVIDLATNQVVFSYDTAHLWESTITGLLLMNKDFLILTDRGKQLMSLSTEAVRIVDDKSGN